MDTTGKRLAWGGLIGCGALSLAANVRSLWIPERVDGADWHSLATPAVPDAGAIIAAVALPIIAAVGVEMVNKWTHLHAALRFGVVGFVSACAMAASFAHITNVLMWYRQPFALAVAMTIAVDGVMILSGLALFTKPKPDVTLTAIPWTPAPDMDSLDTDKPEPLTDTDKAILSGQPDTDTDTVPDTVPDTWTADSVDTVDNPAPVDVIPTPRRSRPDPAWKTAALEMIRTGEPATDREIAEKILADAPDTWATVEAGRKAVSRLRSAA